MYAQAVLPVNSLLHQLVVEAPHLAPDQQLPNVVFVLDNQRSRPVRGRAVVAVRHPDRGAARPRAAAFPLPVGR